MNGVDVKGREVFRLFRAHDPVTGAKREPFTHSSVPASSADHVDEDPVGGRFDLRAPRGTCSLASSRLGLADATITHPLDVLALLTELAACGLGVAGVPHDLPVVQPVAQPQR